MRHATAGSIYCSPNIKLVQAKVIGHLNTSATLFFFFTCCMSVTENFSNTFHAILYRLLLMNLFCIMNSSHGTQNTKKKKRGDIAAVKAFGAYKSSLLWSPDMCTSCDGRATIFKEKFRAKTRGRTRCFFF